MLNRLLQSPSFELLWDPRVGAFRFESPGRVLELEAGVEFAQRGKTRTLTSATLTAGRDAEASLEDVHGEAHQMELHYQEAAGLVLAVRIRLYPGRPFALLRLKVTNVGLDVVALRRFFLQTTEGGLSTSAAPSGCYINGWQSWSPAGFRPIGSPGFHPGWLLRWLQGTMVHNPGTPWARHVDRFWSETVGALITPQEALVGGIASTAEQFGQMYADLRPGHARVLWQTQLDGVPLSPGGSRHSEWFYVEWVPRPNIDPFAQYAYAVARQMSAATRRRTPTGWCSWHVYRRGVSEADVMDNLASAALLADELPLDIIQLDDGYQTAWGDWSTRNDRFPHSLEWLADRIRGSGFEPGLWLAPLVAERSSRLAREHPDWLLRNRSGRPVRAGLVSSFVGRALDPTHPGVEEHVRQVIDGAVDARGYGYLKLGYLYAGALRGRRHDPEMTRAQALRHALEVMREAAGPEAYLVGSGVPLGPAVGLLDAVRIGPDTAPTWEPKVWRLGKLFRTNPSLPSLRNSLRNAATRAWIHGRWWTSDPDVLLLRGSGLTQDEALAQITMVGLSGGSVMLSDVLDALPPEQKAAAAVLFPPLLDGMDVLDLFEEPMPSVAIVPVARPWARWRLIALFNWTEEPIERELPEDVALSERRAYHVVDFWEHRYFLMGPGALRPVLHIPPHGVVLLGLRPVKPEPHLIATTLHISQGGEITEWHLEDGLLTLTLELARFAQGEVWLSLPTRPHTVILNGEQLPDSAVRAVASGIWSIACRVPRTGVLQVHWGEKS